MITAFCILAEPEKLQYPYIESLRSVARFSDKILINFAANTKNKNFRQFEKSSFEKILLLKEKTKNQCSIEIILDENWKNQDALNYDELKNKFQEALDSCKDGWFFKFDADNVFRKDKKNEIKNLFLDDVDHLIFRRINVVTKDKVGINNSSEDIYGLNIDSLKKKNISYEIDDMHNWCRPKIRESELCVSSLVFEEDLMPFNYDATFFTKERLIDFWKKTEEIYSNAQKRENRFKNLSDDQILENHKKYKKMKNSSLKFLQKFQHPEDIKEKMEAINFSHWGYNNFE